MDISGWVLANQICENKSRSLWNEVIKIKHHETAVTSCIDGICDPLGISNIFKNKYETLYQCNNSDKTLMDMILKSVKARITRESYGYYMVTVKDVSEAIKCLNKGKSDGDSGLKTDHLIHAPVQIHVLISFLFSSMLLHGYMPGEYLKSKIIPIPKDNKLDLN